MWHREIDLARPGFPRQRLGFSDRLRRPESQLIKCAVSPSAPQSRTAFTLVELLVAMAILVMLVLLFFQLTGAASSTITLSNKQMDADSQARMLFERMGVDFGRMVKRADLDYSTFKGVSVTNTNTLMAGNDQCAFYSEDAGYYIGASPSATMGYTTRSEYSLVAYNVAPDQATNIPGLQRMSKALGWEPDAANSTWNSMAFMPATLTDANHWPNLFSDPTYFTTVGETVFRFEYTYLLKTSAAQQARYSLVPWDTTLSHTTVNGFQDVAAIVVAIAILDPKSRAIVSNYTKLSDPSLLKEALDPASDSIFKGDIAANWNARVQNTGPYASGATFASLSGLPPSAAAAVHIYQRSFYLDTR